MHTQPETSPGRKTILLFSLEPWGDMWYSKHHYAAELAKDHTVYFISPPDRWRPVDLFSRGIKLRKTPEGVIVVDYRNNVPLRILPHAMARWMHWLTARKLAHLLKDQSNLLWAFHPTPIVLQKVFREKKTQLIYHIVDPYENFRADVACARAANLIVAINPGFLSYYGKLNTNIILISHGVRSIDLTEDQAGNANYSDQWGKYVVLAGALDHRLNYKLLLESANNFQQIKLIMAGPLPRLDRGIALERSRLLALPNVLHVGVAHPDALRHIVGASVGGIVAYHFDNWANRPTNPSGSLKILTYLTQLRPVITTIEDNIPELSDRAIYKVDTEAEFLSRMQQVADGRLGLEEDLVRNYLGRMTYPVFIEKILKHLHT